MSFCKVELCRVSKIGSSDEEYGGLWSLQSGCHKSLRVQTPSKKVFWGSFRGLNPFLGGAWTLRELDLLGFFRVSRT